MVRKNPEENTAYNKAYYDAHKHDKAWRTARSAYSAKFAAKKQYDKRVAEWEQVLLTVYGLQSLGQTDRQIAEHLAKDKKITRAKKNKWIDFSPLSDKSLSSPLPSARPARTQEGE